MCRDDLDTLEIIHIEALHQVLFVLELKERNNSDFRDVSAKHQSDRSHQPVRQTGQTNPMTGQTGLITGQYADSCFKF